MTSSALTFLTLGAASAERGTTGAFGVFVDAFASFSAAFAAFLTERTEERSFDQLDTGTGKQNNHTYEQT